MKWKLYYDDGTTFSSEDGSWAEAPYRGVLVLASEDPEVGRELDHGARGEFFAWWPGATKPWGFDRTGILDYLIEDGEDVIVTLSELSLDDFNAHQVKVGRSVDNHVFAEVLATAITDDFLAPKSASTPREAAE